MILKSKIFRSLFWGLLITLSITFLMARMGLIHIDFSEYLENGLILGSWWIIASLVFFYSGSFKVNRNLLWKVLGLASFLTLILLVDQWMEMPDNPVSIILLILFWMGIAWVIDPRFFIRFRVLIGGVYGLIATLFLVLRFQPNYHEQNHEIAILLLIAPVPLFLLLWVFEHWRGVKELELAKNEAELEMLKNQINPHFFFNTLNNLYGLCVEKSDLAAPMVLKLSEMMRYTIYKGKEKEVLVSEEVEYLESFLELHKMRYHFDPDINFEVSIQNDHKISPLLFLVLVENAFKHGLEPLAEKGWIQIFLESNEEKVKFKVENNYEVKPKEAGIGLENLKRRLELRYPGHFSLNRDENNGVYSVEMEIRWK